MLQNQCFPLRLNLQLIDENKNDNEEMIFSKCSSHFSAHKLNYCYFVCVNECVISYTLRRPHLSYGSSFEYVFFIRSFFVYNFTASVSHDFHCAKFQSAIYEWKSCVCILWRIMSADRMFIHYVVNNMIRQIFLFQNNEKKRKYCFSFPKK